MTAPILHKPARKTYTLAQFLEMEMRSDVRHEFHNGKIINMPGGTLTHNLIGTRITTLLNNFIDSQKKDLYVFGSDQMCYIEAQNKVLYPDVTVVAGGFKSLKGRGVMVTNPILIFEVLSPGTENYDRTLKFDSYSTIPSLQEYVLVSQDKPSINVFYRKDENQKEFDSTQEEGLDAAILLKSIDFEMTLKDAYLRTGVSF